MNLSKFDEASKAGFTQDNMNFNRGRNIKQNEDDMYPSQNPFYNTNKNKNIEGNERVLTTMNLETESIDENIEFQKFNTKPKVMKKEELKIEDKEFTYNIPIEDDIVAPFPTIPDNFQRVPFVKIKESYGPFRLDQVELIEQFNTYKKTNNFKKYLRKYENTDSIILRYLTNTTNFINSAGIDLDKNSHSNFIKHTTLSSTNKIKLDSYARNMFSTVTDRDAEDVELEGYSEQILGFKNTTLNEAEGYNMNIEETFKKMLFKRVSNPKLPNNNVPNNCINNENEDFNKNSNKIF